jgi:hypothetical protein
MLARGMQSKRWVYDGVAGRFKHRWGNPYPGFEQLPCGTWIGKCPSDVTTAEAEELINGGVEEWSGVGAESYPDMIFVIRGQYVYRAYPTLAGVSYHAFPDCPRQLKKLPKSIRTKIVALADAKGCGDHVRRVVGLKR